MSKDLEAAPEARPKMTPAELRKAAQCMSELALETLAAIMQGTGQDSARLAAAREVLDRGHGKPKPAAKAKTAKGKAQRRSLKVIVKRFADITPEEEAAAAATERGEW